jgi:hypothetical protein
MSVTDAKNFLFTLYKVENGTESLGVSIEEAEARLSETEVSRIKEKAQKAKEKAMSSKQ